MICSNCGTEIEDDSNFCYNCGKKNKYYNNINSESKINVNGKKGDHKSDKFKTICIFILICGVISLIFIAYLFFSLMNDSEYIDSNSDYKSKSSQYNDNYTINPFTGEIKSSDSHELTIQYEENPITREKKITGINGESTESIFEKFMNFLGFKKVEK